VDGIPVFDVKKIAALAEDFLLVIPLNTQPLLEMYFTDPLQQQVMGGFIDRV
jgi:hypothetical protein